MRHILLVASVLCSLLFLVSCKSSMQTSVQKPVKLLVGGSGWGYIAVVDKTTGQKEWEFPLEKGWECNAVDILPNGNYLFAYSKGAKVVDHEGNEIWNIPAPKKSQMHTAQLLPNGHCLLAAAGTPAIIWETTIDGKILKRVEYETGIKNPHAQFRQVTKDKKGNYIMPLFKGEILVLSPQGKLLKTIKLEGTQPFAVLNIKKDIYWVTCGDYRKLLKVDFKSCKVLAEYKDFISPEAKLHFVAGMCHSDHGGIYVANWQGHTRKGSEKPNNPQLIEIDENGKLLWKLEDKKDFGMLSAVNIIP